MRELVLRLQREGGHTTVFVTHNQEEALVLADRIALIFDGRLQMYDRPDAPSTTAPPPARSPATSAPPTL